MKKNTVFMILITISLVACQTVSQPDAESADQIEISNIETKKKPKNLLFNGDFNCGFNHWEGIVHENEGAEASFITENNKLSVTISKPGTSNWHIQVIQSGIPLEQSAEYQVTVEMAATQERSVDLAVSRNGGASGIDFSYYGTTNVSLTTEMQAYTFSFVMNEPNDDDSRFVIEIGGQTGDVEIQNVVIEKNE